MGTKYVDLTEGDFDYNGYTPGNEGVVATVQVPNTQVWQIDVGAPIVCALVTKQTVTVTSGATDETAQLSPEAPVVDYMDDPTSGQYTEEAFITAYYDDDDDGSKDTLVTDSTSVQYAAFGSDGDFVDSIDFTETEGAGDVEVDVYTVIRHGYVKFRKRNSGKSNVTQELQNEDALTWAFSNPDDPNSDRQVTWNSANNGLRGVLPPKFNFDLVFFDKTNGVSVDQANATNIVLSIPIRQRPLGRDEEPADLRRRVSQAMVS